MSGNGVNLDRLPPLIRDAAQNMRRAVIEGAQRLETDAPVMASTSDFFIAGAEGTLPARLYVPDSAQTRGPAILFFHGGGFVVGDLESHEMLCRRLADAAGMRVIAVAYRLAPRHKFPAAPEDCYAAMLWLAAHGDALGVDTRQIAVAGDSAGGNLAAVVCLLARDRDGPRLFAQALLYPCTQLVEMKLPQLKMLRGDALAQSVQDWFRDAYLTAPDEAKDPRCSPLLASSLAELAPAYVLTAGFDPLRDEGRAYAHALAQAGVPVTMRDHPNMVHGFLNLTVILPTARGAIADAGQWLREQALLSRAAQR